MGPAVGGTEVGMQAVVSFAAYDLRRQDLGPTPRPRIGTVHGRRQQEGTAHVSTPALVRTRPVPGGAAGRWARARTALRGPDHDAYRAWRTFEGIDGLRALAALWVLFFHLGGTAFAGLHGWIGVEVFFVLSGFLITTLVLREEERHGKVSLVAFLVRRQFRIVPVYLAVLALVWLDQYVRRTGLDDLSTATPFYLTFVNDWAPSSAAYSQTWTIGIEQKFYVLWSVMAFGLVLAWRTRVWLLLLVAGALLSQWQARPWHTVHFVVLLSGSLLALLLHDRRTFRMMAPVLTPLGGIVAVVAWAVFQCWLGPLLDVVGETRTVVVVGGMACLLLGVLGPGPVRRVMASAPLRFVGRRSYAIYLVQFVAFHVVATTVPGLSTYSVGTALVSAVVSLALADLLHRTVERPMIGAGRRVSDRFVAARRRAAPATGPV